jgi:hypothetical protein
MAHAMDVATYEKLKKNDVNTLKIYIGALGEGMSWANSALTSKGAQPIYCGPQTIPLYAGNYMNIIDDQIKKERREGNIDKYPIGLLLILGLEQTLSCEESTSGKKK